MTKRDDDSEAKAKDAAAESEEAKKPLVGPDTSAEDEDDEDEDDEEEEAEAAPARQPSRAKAASSKTPARRSSSAKPAAAAAASLPMSKAALFAIVALAAGGAAGWFGHDAQAKAHIKAESAAAPAGSGKVAGPCGAWEEKICKASGDKSAVCAQAKGAVELLTPASCETALSVMPATLAKLKAARASCDSLVSKLCGDLPPGSQACALVKDKTPAFPSARCDEMLKHYDEVLSSLREMDQQGMPGMGGPGPGGPGPGMQQRPMGAPPGMARPPISAPGH